MNVHNIRKVRVKYTAIRIVLPVHLEEVRPEVFDDGVIFVWTFSVRNDAVGTFVYSER